MKKTLNFLLMLVMVAAVLSCKKKDVQPKIVGKYKITVSSTTITPVGTGSVRVEDNLLNRPACQADDTGEFTSDGKIIFSDGALICVSATPRPNIKITYVLSPDEKTLKETITDGVNSRTEELTVLELTDSVLKTVSKSRIYEFSVDNNGTEVIISNAVNNRTLTKI